jgi:hypothetical protein
VEDITRNLVSRGVSEGKSFTKRSSQSKWFSSLRGISSTDLHKTNERGKALKPKRPPLMPHADALRYTSSLIDLTEPFSAISVGESKSPENRERWTTQHEEQQLCMEPSCLKMRTVSHQPLLDVKIPSSPFLLPTTVMQIGLEPIPDSSPPKSHRKGSLRSDTYWPSPSSIALRLAPAPEVNNRLSHNPSLRESKSLETIVKRSPSAFLEESRDIFEDVSLSNSRS